jgi:hypothetical protein
MSGNIIKYIVLFVDKYRLEVGSINGIIFAVGIIELLSHSIGKSVVAFFIGIFVLFFSWQCLFFKNQAYDISTEDN